MAGPQYEGTAPLRLDPGFERWYTVRESCTKFARPNIKTHAVVFVALAVIPYGILQMLNKAQAYQEQAIANKRVGGKTMHDRMLK